MHINLNGNPMLLIAAISMAGLISGQIAIVPGGLGIQEICYGAFLLPIFEGNLSNLNFILLFNRIITYYTPLIIGALFQFIPKPKLTRRTDIVEGFFVAEEKEEENFNENIEDTSLEN